MRLMGTGKVWNGGIGPFVDGERGAKSEVDGLLAVCRPCGTEDGDGDRVEEFVGCDSGHESKYRRRQNHMANDREGCQKREETSNLSVYPTTRAAACIPFPGRRRGHRRPACSSNIAPIVPQRNECQAQIKTRLRNAVTIVARTNAGGRRRHERDANRRSAQRWDHSLPSCTSHAKTPAKK